MNYFKKLLLLLLIFNFQILTLFSQTPYWNWVKHAGGTDYDEASTLILNNDNNLTIAGFFRGTAWFPTDTFTAGLSNALFIAEYDKDGNMLWVKHVADASGGIVPKYLFQDTDGNYYIVGTFGAYTFGGSVTFFPSTSFTSDGHVDIFIAKLDETGTFLWAQAIRSAESPVAAYTAILDDDNNTLIAGTLYGQHIFTSTTNDTIFSDANWHIYIAKYTSSGMLAGVNNVISSGQVMYPAGITTDPGNNVYLTGKYNGKPVFGIVPDTFSIAQSTFYDALFISRFALDGTEARWAYPGISTSGHFPFTLDTDEENNLLVSGIYNLSTTLTSASGSVTLTPPATSEIFLAAYDTTGVILWAKNAGHCTGGVITVTDAIHDKDSLIYLTGIYTGTPTFGEGASTTYIPAVNDFFVAQYNETGTHKWAQRGGGVSGENSYAITNDSDGNVYIAGHYNLAAVFDSSATVDFTVPSYGYTDIMLARLGDEGLPVSINESSLYSSKGVQIYPNPAYNTITVLPANNEAIKSITLLNNLGQVIAIQQNATNELHIATAESGLYFLQITTAEGMVMKRVVIAH
jgi:hypothetical protein